MREEVSARVVNGPGIDDLGLSHGCVA
jgi:hypothetical protein